MRKTAIHLVVPLALMICAGREAGAAPRFGDSTWVAPAWPIDGDTTSDGPRVAPADHEPRWETALRMPFRIVFFPLRLVGIGMEAGVGATGERVLGPKTNRPPSPGPHMVPFINPGGVSDIGVGPAITWNGVPTADAKLRLAASWSTIDRRRVRFSEEIGDRRPVGFRLRADYDYKPNRHFYGIGNGTSRTDLSYFLLESTNAEAALLLGSSPAKQLRIVGGYSSMTPRRGYHGSPLLEEVFTAPAQAPYGHRSTQELTYGITGDYAALDDGRDPSLGVHVRVDLRHAAGLRAVDPDYNQWRIEGRAYVPVFAKRRVIAVRGMYAGVDPTGGTTTLPFYRLVQSEGTTRFAGFASERFRDRRLVLARAEYRWAIISRLSAVALYELAEVAPSVGAFDLHATHKSYGGGLRLGRSEESTLRLEIAHGVEGLQAALLLGSDF